LAAIGSRAATDKLGLVAGTTDLTAAIDHLRAADPVLRGLIDQVGADSLGDRRIARPRDHYGALVRTIVGQQLSTRAARAIHERLTERFGGRAPTPEEILADDPDELRTSVGLSHAKVRYLRSLALDKLGRLSDDEVIARLTAVSGIGLWSSHMFLMFHLQRQDVLPVGDLGIRKAFQVVYGLPELPEAAEMEQIAEPWRPYRSVASLFLWRAASATPV
jgi:DNA-3-methyladenine glycosylase II